MRFGRGSARRSSSKSTPAMGRVRRGNWSGGRHREIRPASSPEWRSRLTGSVCGTADEPFSASIRSRVGRSNLTASTAATGMPFDAANSCASSSVARSSGSAPTRSTALTARPSGRRASISQGGEPARRPVAAERTAPLGSALRTHSTERMSRSACTAPVCRSPGRIWTCPGVVWFRVCSSRTAALEELGA
jgi:hypothetical protein